MLFYVNKHNLGGFVVCIEFTLLLFLLLFKFLFINIHLARFCSFGSVGTSCWTFFSKIFVLTGAVTVDDLMLSSVLYLFHPTRRRTVRIFLYPAQPEGPGCM